jgi:hypothetical protein
MVEQSDYIGHAIPAKDSYGLTGFQENYSAFLRCFFFTNIKIFSINLKNEIYLN